MSQPLMDHPLTFFFFLFFVFSVEVFATSAQNCQNQWIYKSKKQNNLEN